MSRQIGRPNPTSQARLQLLLAVLATWNILAFALQLVNASILEMGDVDGVLGARALSGSSGALALAYLFALRNPLRYRFIVWLAAVEQAVALFAYTFHWARGDTGAGETLLPIAIALALLVLLVSNLPRQTDSM